MRCCLLPVAFFAVLSFPGTGKAQESALGSWNILSLKYNYSKKLSFFGEAQLRSLKFYNNFHYHEVKGGFNYKPNSGLSLTLGGGKYDTYREGGNFAKPKNNEEIRIWPQVALHQSLGNFKVEQRYRAELRFTSDGYRNRFRYRLGLSYPFGKGEKDEKPFLVSASNELFFTNREPYFERDRFLLALNYRVSDLVSLQTGYIYQFDYKINDETGRNFFVLGLYFELMRKGEKREQNNYDLNDN
jgi:hypothetical protein